MQYLYKTCNIDESFSGHDNRGAIRITVYRTKEQMINDRASILRSKKLSEDMYMTRSVYYWEFAWPNPKIDKSCIDEWLPMEFILAAFEKVYGVTKENRIELLSQGPICKPKQIVQEVEEYTLISNDVTSDLDHIIPSDFKGR